MSQEQDMIKGMLGYVKNLLSPQFRTSDDRKNDERVARRAAKFAFRRSFGCPTTMKREEGCLPLVPANPAQTEKGKTF